MKVVLSTIGRFHMFALARQLRRFGVLEKIFTGFWKPAVAREGIPPDMIVSIPWIRTPLMGFVRSGLCKSSWIYDTFHNLSLTVHDRLVAERISECQVFVGHEGVGLRSGKAARERGARYICDRGCSHIGWQHHILQEEYDRVGLVCPPASRSMRRELLEYDLADRIVVPSTFAQKSFIQAGVAQAKIKVVPYGVEPHVFRPIQRDATNRFEVIFVGNLSVRKGAHDLFRAFRMLEFKEKRLTLVGQVASDVAAALSGEMSNADVRVVGHVQHDKLHQIMSNSDVLILPSIEDGFGMVLAEAMASGCPVIATEHTGAIDLITDGREGYVVPIRRPDLIAERLTGLARSLDLREEMRVACRQRIEAIEGWNRYGEKMMTVYHEALHNSK